jgi:hypothetical protein
MQILQNKQNMPNYNLDNNINNNKNYLKNNSNYNYVDKDEENGAEFNYDDCFLCGIKQRENIQDKFFICRECDRLLCQNCKKKHDLINPNHNLVISYISGEIDNKDNIDNEPNHHICIHCQNRILNENNNNNLENMRYNLNNEENINYNNNAKNNNNSNIKLRKEKINQNIQSMQILQNKQNMPNYNLDNNINNNNLDKDNILYKSQNMNQSMNKSYPYDNDDYNNMKTQYQNDYSDKYTLYKNLMNNKNNNEYNNNNNNANININNINNNNREYYNPIDEYENMENNKEIINRNNNNMNNEYINDNNQNINTLKNISPTKKRILNKRYDNTPYQNNANDNKDFNYYDNDDYNNEQINENKKQDLFQKRKCKIEFDLNKDEREFAKCEVFGNPVCYNCLKSKKDEKNFKIFYCSQCMKLFCKDCLYQHNYISASDN